MVRSQRFVLCKNNVSGLTCLRFVLTCLNNILAMFYGVTTKNNKEIKCDKKYTNIIF